MCNICGLNCGKGGSLKVHVELKHSPVTYEAYKICFGALKVIADSWNDSLSTTGKDGVKRKAVIHTLVRLFSQDQQSKPVTRSVT